MGSRSFSRPAPCVDGAAVLLPVTLCCRTAEHTQYDTTNRGVEPPRRFQPIFILLQGWASFGALRSEQEASLLIMRKRKFVSTSHQHAHAHRPLGAGQVGDVHVHRVPAVQFHKNKMALSAVGHALPLRLPRESRFVSQILGRFGMFSPPNPSIAKA